MVACGRAGERPFQSAMFNVQCVLELSRPAWLSRYLYLSMHLKQYIRVRALELAERYKSTPRAKAGCLSLVGSH